MKTDALSGHNLASIYVNNLNQAFAEAFALCGFKWRFYLLKKNLKNQRCLYMQ